MISIQTLHGIIERHDAVWDDEIALVDEGRALWGQRYPAMAPELAAYHGDRLRAI
jgi:hypothetical protein